MKKTVSIQISGMLFHVDDDAYARLELYLQSIRDHFAHLADRDEIISDIESRIAEKFSEKMKKSKQTVTMKDVETLIESMGTVEDFEAFEAETEKETVQEKKKTDGATRPPPRRFYRNPDDKVIAGVASGIASYFNIDPVFVRVVFVALGFVNGIGVIAYIILWIAMPLAKTHSERMEMQGQPMTLSGLEKKIQRSTHTFETEAFTSIYTRGGVKLHIREGKKCRVAARGSQNDLKNMLIHVIDGQLRLEREDGSWLGFLFRGFKHLSFDITLPDLTEVDVAGACAVDIDGFHGKEIRLRAVGASSMNVHTNAKILYVHVEGASSAKIAGTGDAIHATAIGASSLNARAFEAVQGHADISGASSAHLFATDTVDGQATGASSLCVYGSPTVTATASGASSVKNKDKSSEPDPKEWQQDVTYDDHKMYTQVQSPISRFFRFIGRIIRMVFLTIVRIIGGIIATVTGIALIFMIIAVIRIIQTGYIPYINMGPITDYAPLGYLYLAVACVIVFVPVLFLMQIGTSMIDLKRRFSIGGAITLFVVWIVMIAGAAFAGGILFPDLRHVETGTQITKSFDLKDFTAINASGSDRITVRQGTGFTITATGPDEDVQALRLATKNNALIIQHRKDAGFCIFCDPHRVSLHITLPSLTALTTGDLTRTTVEGFSGTSLTVVSGDLSHISLSGSTDLLRLTTNDLSHVDAFDFPVREAKVSLHDLSYADLQVTEKISGTTNDLSKLHYRGSASGDVRSDDMSGVSSDSFY